MRAGIFLTVATGAATVLACYKPKPPEEMHPIAAMQSVAMPPPPSLQKPNDVSVTVNCLDNGGFSSEVVPYRAIIPESDKSITWTLYSSEINREKVDSVYMVPKNDATWAFDDKSIKVKKGGLKVKLKQNAVTDFLYKYNIMVSCHGSVILIDPDMIIPKET
ncbi:MAG: hypothetical protein ABIZ36_02720 [Gemmatimonadaceae bacterium]